MKRKRCTVQLSNFPEYMWEVVDENEKLIKKFKTNAHLIRWWRAQTGQGKGGLTHAINEYISAIKWHQRKHDELHAKGLPIKYVGA